MSSGAPRSARQVPGEEAFDADDEVFPVGGNGLEKGRGGGLHLAVPHDLPGLIQATEVQGAGGPVDAAVNLVRRGVEAPGGSSS